MSACNAALEGCVASLRSSMQLLDSSINILDSAVSDYPRLARVLQSTRHYELVSESDLDTAQSALCSEIQPEVDNLLNRVSTHLDKLERREQSLIAKCDLQEGRLNRNGPPAMRAKSPARRGLTRRDGGEGAVSSIEEVKMQQLRQKKERLSYAVGRLELQATQKERQLRKSMAGTGGLNFNED
ncbi:hypothetical protein AAFC00_005837 [Neodothiora populina]|uniref:DASH complex subunit SPC19 n=1 Tax=Neodothiora populina TaxID=2781224 RepID=A0ABR3P604_9PEZI